MSLKMRTLTLGCKVNQYETEFVRQGLLGIGYEDADKHEQADLCVVNSCTVTAEADSKSRQAIRRMARKNPGAQIVVMGCYATRAPEELAKLPGVSEVVTDKRELPDLLGRFGVVDIPKGISRFGNRQRAYVKVQDGCLLRCSYCIIPHVRPKPYSRPLSDILEEIRRLMDNGYREIVLTGIHLGHYGVENNWHKPKSEWLRLANLLQRIVAIPGDFRIRLSSIEATEVTRELLSVMADNADKICPHLHICMQSGSDRILRKMKRRWGTKRFLDRCEMVKDRLDNPALTTDVIVGFPGETESDFRQTCQAVHTAEFSKIHMFPFSPRRGTPAAEMTGQVDKSEKTQRGQRLAEIENDLRGRYFASLVGSQLQVLVEAEHPSCPSTHLGTSCRYAPVEIQDTDRCNGQLMNVFALTSDSEKVLAGLSKASYSHLAE